MRLKTLDEALAVLDGKSDKFSHLGSIASQAGPPYARSPEELIQSYIHRCTDCCKSYPGLLAHFLGRSPTSMIQRREEKHIKGAALIMKLTYDLQALQALRVCLSHALDQPFETDKVDIDGALLLLDGRIKGRRGGCTEVWLAGSIAYRCRDCQTNESSAICCNCFKVLT